jgi:hypothetical protein
MKPHELHIWRKRQNFGSWKAAALVLSLPYSRMLRLKNGEEKIPLEVEFACAAFECGRFDETIEDWIASYSKILRYSWFCPRILKVIELPHDDRRREELAIALLLGLTAVMAKDFAIPAPVILKRMLSRIWDEGDNNIDHPNEALSARHQLDKNLCDGEYPVK